MVFRDNRRDDDMNSQIWTLTTLSAVATDEQSRRVDRLTQWTQQIDEMEAITQANIARQRELIQAEAIELEREIVAHARENFAFSS